MTNVEKIQNIVMASHKKAATTVANLVEIKEFLSAQPITEEVQFALNHVDRKLNEFSGSGMSDENKCLDIISRLCSENRILDDTPPSDPEPTGTDLGTNTETVEPEQELTNDIPDGVSEPVGESNDVSGDVGQEPTSEVHNEAESEIDVVGNDGGQPEPSEPDGDQADQPETDIPLS